jgi:sulfur carrier protein
MILKMPFIKLKHKETAMQVVINGERKELSGKISIKEMLKECNVKMPDMVSVELNDQIISRDKYDEQVVNENDRIEFLYFMGGGTK